jgi:tetratricopeptide (TPR) repeat protein
MKSSKILFLILMLNIECSLLNAQGSPEAMTLEFYNQKKWVELVKIGTNALSKDKDNYVLNYRVGIAYYELKKYRKSLCFFQRAYKINSDDKTLKEYLYYNYLYTEQYGEAEKTGYKPTKIIQMASVAGGTKLYNVTPIYRQSKINPFTFQRDTLYKNNFFTSVGMLHSIGKGHHLYHDYSYSYLHQRIENKYQHQYYVQADFSLPGSIIIKPAFHFIDFSNKSETKSYADTGTKEFVYALSVTKQFKMMNVGLNNSLSTLNDSLQIQHSISIELFPLYNNKLSFYYAPIFHTLGLYKNIHLIHIMGVKFTPIKEVSASVSYYNGDAFYVSEDNGSLVYNNPDKLQQRIQAIINFNIKYKLMPFVLYNYEQKVHNEPRTSTLYPFSNHTFVAGIKYIF